MSYGIILLFIEMAMLVLLLKIIYRDKLLRRYIILVKKILLKYSKYKELDLKCNGRCQRILTYQSY